MEVMVKTAGGTKKILNVEAQELAKRLRKSTKAEVRFDEGSRALYSTAGGNYRQVPIGVVIPKTVQDIVQTMSICREFGVPVLARGGGTSLAGQCCNVAVVIDCSKYLRGILQLDPGSKRARVQPGVVLDDLRNAAEKHRLTFAPDPSTHDHCTLGGMIGNNSCGVHSVMGGKTVDNIEELRVLTYDGLELTVGATDETQLAQIIGEGGRRGEIYRRMRELRDKYAEQIRARYPKIPRRVSGYNLDQLLPENGFHVARALVGTEGTCVTVLEALTRLVDSPPYRSLVILGYPDVFSAGDHVTQVLEFHPIGLEGMDDRLIADMKKKHMHPEDISLLPEGKGWLLVEFGGQSKEESDHNAKKMMEALKKESNAPSMKLFDDKDEEEQVWKTRESGLGATAFVPGSPVTWEGWEDSAVPPANLGNYLRDFRALLDRYKYGCDLYGHFGDGCVHTRIDFDFFTAKGIATYRSFVHDAAHLVVKHGGSLSGEHGDGQSRAELLPIMFGGELVNAFREFKSIWDPQWKMNPGKVVDPYRVDENLRLGTDYAPEVPKTHFVQFGDDQTFPQASMRCVGVGKCRREGSGTMCPSYMVTHEEEHSTRGRSRLLFEIMRGDFLRDKWRNESVHDALDLCLSCKGCKSDCPVNVDMATYKSEFLSHYYAGRIRPSNAYAIGWIHWWSRIAGHAPGLVNAAMHAPVLGNFAKRLARVSVKRDIPRFAAEPFTREWKRKAKRNGFAGKPRPVKGKVILWADTFNNFFEPSVLHSAAQVLQFAGFEVRLPVRQLCCGRPLYDYGMLTTARHLLKKTLSALRAEIRAGIPLVILEPSCAAVFRDELKNMLPHDEDARRLSEQTFIFSEFLEKHNFQPPRLEKKALVHVHCHHKAVAGVDAEQKLLKNLGLDFEILDSGCCGMAGGFGYEADHYEISLAVGERVLLPAVRAASPNTLLIADGFSCREQIVQGAERNAFHPCQIVHMAIRQQQSHARNAERKAA
jgi:FAD/FMN-containing dehydrogenase/Fe-S oxidoreductase